MFAFQGCLSTHWHTHFLSLSFSLLFSLSLSLLFSLSLSLTPIFSLPSPFSLVLSCTFFPFHRQLHFPQQCTQGSTRPPHSAKAKGIMGNTGWHVQWGSFNQPGICTALHHTDRQLSNGSAKKSESVSTSVCVCVCVCGGDTRPCEPHSPSLSRAGGFTAATFVKLR